MSKSAFFAAAVLAAVMNTAAMADTEEIVLGYLPAGGGAFATLSKTNLIAAKIAIDEINASGGVNGKKLRIVSFDTAGKPDQAVVGVRKFAQDDMVMAIIGPFSSSECRVAFPSAEREGVVAMSMASSAPNLAKGFNYAFRNTSDEAYMFNRVMQALKSHGMPIATGAVAYATDDVISKTMGEKVLPALMQTNGTKIEVSVTFQTQAFDLSPQVSELAAHPAELVGVGSGPEPAVRLVQEMRRQGVKGRVVGGSTIADPELPHLMGKAGDGTTIPTTFYGNLNGRTKAFEAALIKGAKAEGIERTAAAQFDAATYDIVLIYAEAMKKAKVTGDPGKLSAERTAVRDEIRKMKDFPALEGAISFGENGDALKPVYVIEMKESKWTLLEAFPAGK